MGIKRYRDFDAWQLAQAFKLAVFELVRGSEEAKQDRRFRSQLIESARAPTKHIAEGFLRRSPRTFAQYLDYALSSIGEAEEHVDDGIEMGYFTRANCVEALRLAKRCTAALSRLRDSQLRYAEEQRDARTPPRRQARQRRPRNPTRDVPEESPE